jgi:hypothetical protein
MIKITYHLLQKMKLKLAKDKTYIGLIQRGFYFLGYRFEKKNEKNNEKKISLTVSKACQSRMQQKVAQLYEQYAPEKTYRALFAAGVNMGKRRFK